MLPRQRAVLIATLLALAAAAWALIVWQAGGSSDGGMGLTMGLTGPVFLATWVAMMVAMMLPAALPVILTFARIQSGKRARGHDAVPVWLFVAAYLVVWAGAGAIAYAGAVVGDALAERSSWLADAAPRIGAVTLIAAGVYQLTPLKRTCLTACRSPMSWIMTSWRDGLLGAVRMGVEHGVYCLGCCWLLFVILFPLGMMNVGAVALVAALIFAEKMLPAARATAAVAALALVAYGAAVLVRPQLLPTTTADSGMASMTAADR